MFWVSALMSPTSNVTPFIVTACCGSGDVSAAGVHAWQVPHQPWMPSMPSLPYSSVLPSPSLSMPSCILPPPWKLAACHFAAGPAQVLYASHLALAPVPYISGCVSQPGALLNAASYFSSGDFTDGPCQRA